MDEERNYVVFEDENGNEVEFDIIEEFEYDSKNYAILMDLSKLPEDGEQEEVEQDLCIVELVRNGDEEEFLPIEDKELFEKVADYAYNLLDAEECGCGCDDCDGECDCDKE